MQNSRAAIEELVLEYNMARIPLAEEEATIVVSIEDVTERKRTEKALRESEEKYRSLVNNIKLGIFRSTPGAHGKFIEVNLAMEEITGYSRGELLSMNVSDLYVRPEERETVVEEVASAIWKTAKELNFKRKDGTEIVVSDTKVAVKNNTGRVLYFDGIIEDITERKRAEEEVKRAYAQLKQTQAQLIQAEKAEIIGRLATGVAHEVKNPLTIIMQGIDFLSANVPLDKASVSLTLKQMNDAVMRADNITKGLLSFSRAGEIKKMPQHLSSIIEDSLLFVKNLVDKYHIKVIKELGEDIPSLNLDKSRMEQVFLNLFLNAIDAMPGGGLIKVRTYHEERVEEKVKHGAGETTVIAEIEDAGTGIPAEIMDKIFDPFFTTKREKGGTGLGLSIVKNIMEMHNGKIKIENITDRSGVRVTLVFKE